MELRQLATFRAVAQALSFTRAAEQLSYAQSSVTAQIQALEAELGVRLFDRLGRHVQLTGPGQRLLEFAERLLRLEQEARAVVAHGEEPAGELLVGAPETLCAYRLPPVVLRLRADAPLVRLTFRPGISSELRRAVLDGRLDAAFLLERLVTQAGLVVEPLRAEALLLLGPAGHPLATHASVHPADLAGEPVFAPEAGSSYRVLFEQILRDAQVVPGAIFEFASVEAIKQCVRTGLGITVLPAMAVVDELASGDLVELAWAGPPLAVWTQMVYHQDKWRSPALEALLGAARDGTR